MDNPTRCGHVYTTGGDTVFVCVSLSHPDTPDAHYYKAQK